MPAANPTVIVDTNVLIAAMLGSRTAQHTFHAIIKTPYLWFISPGLLRELSDVPFRTKFEGVITPTLLRATFRRVRRHAQLIHPTSAVHACRDPNDNHVLAAALDSHATHLITSDRDLLSLSPFRGIAIVTPAEFLAQLKNR